MSRNKQRARAVNREIGPGGDVSAFSPTTTHPIRLAAGRVIDE
jgi:hypothetical protein